MKTPLHCPFCGSTRVGQHTIKYSPAGQEPYCCHVIGCDGCGANGPSQKSENDALKAWDKRAAEKPDFDAGNLCSLLSKSLKKQADADYAKSHELVRRNETQGATQLIFGANLIYRISNAMETVAEQLGQAEAT